MEKQSNLIHSQSPAGLTTSSNLVTGTVIKNQPKEEVLKHIAVLLIRLGKLYGIKDFDEMSAVLLAEWTYGQYQYEEIQIVTRVLHNPPRITDERGVAKTNWRLTPDTISEWMRIELEKVSEKREQRHNEKKLTHLPVTLDNIKDRFDEVMRMRDNAKDSEEKERLDKQLKEIYSGIDYESYKKRLESGWLDRSDKKVDDNYEKFKTEYLMNKAKSNP